MPSLLEPFEHEFQGIINKINEEIKRIDDDIAKAGDVVEGDLDELVEKYRTQIERHGLDRDTIKDDHRASLIRQRIESLEKAREKLLKLKDEIRILRPGQLPKSDRAGQLALP